MKPKLEGIVSIFLIFFLAFFVVLSISTWCKVSAKPDLPVHNIVTGLDYVTIQEAIDAPETLSGHTILVDNGTYYEHVIVNKAVKLLGTSQSTIIDGNGTEYVVSLTTSGAEITGFSVQNGVWGVNLRNVQNVSVTENMVFNCSYGGIIVYSCSECRIENNTVLSTNEAGIYLWGSVQVLITNNTVANTSHGIYLLVHSTNNIIENNFVTNNPQGIVLSISCNNNTIFGNTVTSSRVGGIVMGGAHNNTIYHNNLLNNPEPFFSYGGSSNFWDDGMEGNFWEEYLGSDMDEDGIGDTSYPIDENNQDNHPLMGIFMDFNVALEEETRHVYVISNSTVSNFEFRVTYEPEIRKLISFNVTGEDGTVGFCRVMIPTALMNYSYTVLVNGEEVDTTVLDVSNSTHAYLYFTYNPSTKHVLIVTESLSDMVLPLFMIHFVLIVVFFKKRKSNDRVVSTVDVSLLRVEKQYGRPWMRNNITMSQPINTRLRTNFLRIYEKVGKGS